MDSDTAESFPNFVKIIHPGAILEPWATAWNIAGIRVFCRIVYKDNRLSITGVQGPKTGGDAYGNCGQINPLHIDSFTPGWTPQMLSKFNDIWERWHLNDLRPGCPHQQAEEWHKIKLDDTKETGWHVDNHANLAMWARPEEHPRGILGKPCPVCGYKFGTAWNLEPVPDEVLKWLKALPSTDVNPAWV